VSPISDQSIANQFDVVMFKMHPEIGDFEISSRTFSKRAPNLFDFNAFDESAEFEEFAERGMSRVGKD
jgi:hypothetical protein